MDTKRKYWIIYSITAVIVLLLVGGIFLLFWSDLNVRERGYAELLAPKLIAYAITGMVANLLLFGSLLRHIFRSYIDPIARLAEETELIAVANAKYRIVPVGGPEVVGLTREINELADKHISLKTDVQQIVQLSKRGLDDEKRRLETLMAQIPEGVVVCNVDGRILLYNHQAQQIMAACQQKTAHTGKGGPLGLGRSIFGILDRRPILHALDALQGRLEDEAHPTFNFTTSRQREQFLRVRMAAVASRDDEPTIDGYVLTIADITSQLQADSRRDIFLQSLTIGLQQELTRIRSAAATLASHPAVQTPDLARHGETIDASTGVLLEQIEQVAVKHAYRLQDPGEVEFILGSDLMNVLHETLIDKFNLDAQLDVDADLWLHMNSYTVVRGVVYLMGQLTQHQDVKQVTLGLAKDGEDGFLSVQWVGDAVKVRTIEQWKECPLMLGAKGRGPVSLSNMLAGRGDISSTLSPEEEAVSVRFRLEVQKPQTKWNLDPRKEHRPIYYEFDLFDAKHQSAELDEVNLDSLTYVVFDTETTGLDPSGGDEIVSLAGIRIVRGKLRREEVFDQLVDPRRSIPLESLRIHEIYPEMLRGMPVVAAVLPEFHQFVEGAVLVAHNAAFDMRFLELKEDESGVRFDQPVIDTLLLSAVVHPNQEPHNLETVAERLGLPVVGRHTALGDAILTGEVLLRLIPLLASKGIKTLAQAREASRDTRFSRIEF